MENMDLNSGAVPPPNHPMGMGFGDTLANMRFIGWIGMVYGILTCLSIVGAIIGIPLIIASNRFLGGIKRFEIYRYDCSEHELRAGFEDLGSSFKTLKILSIVYIVLTVCYFGLMITMFSLGLLSELASG